MGYQKMIAFQNMWWAIFSLYLLVASAIGLEDGSTQKEKDLTELRNLDDDEAADSPTCYILLRVTDAVADWSRMAIDQATVAYNDKSIETDSAGFVTLPQLPKDANLTLSVDKPGYDTFRDEIVINDHCGSIISVALNPKSSYGRIVLTWNSNVPKDVVLKVRGKSGALAGNKSKSNWDGGIYGGAETWTLDVDDQDGPYIVYVRIRYTHNTRFDGGINELCEVGTKITLYDGNHGQVKTLEIPDYCEGNSIWIVGCLDSFTDLGSINVKNQMYGYNLDLPRGGGEEIC